jgi:hypothetical protein
MVETPTACWSCHRALDPDDRYCRRCGQGQGAFVAWYYRPLWIALLAFTALGPFALLLIWRTPRLGTSGKWIASLALIAVSVWIGWGFAVEFRRAFEVLQNGDELLSL